MVLAVTVLWLVVAGCGLGHGDEDEDVAVVPQRIARGGIQLSAADQHALGLEVTTASEGELPDSVVRFGVVLAAPGDDADVVSPTDGHLDGPPKVAQGAEVTAGAVLLAVVPGVSGGDAASATRLPDDLKAARADLAVKKAAVARDRALVGQAVSQVAFDQELAEEQAARAKVDGLVRAVAAWQRGRGDEVQLRAPITGRVAQLVTRADAPVRSGDVLVRVVREAPRQIDLAVPSGDPTGTEYQVLAGAHDLPAHLLARGAVVGADGARHDRLQVEAGTLEPGRTVSVRVARGSTSGVVLPEAALVRGVAADEAWVEVRNGVFAPRTVHVAARYGGRVRLDSGVKPGERVVVKGVMGLLGESERAAITPAD